MIIQSRTMNPELNTFSKQEIIYKKNDFKKHDIIMKNRCSLHW